MPVAAGIYSTVFIPFLNSALFPNVNTINNYLAIILGLGFAEGVRRRCLVFIRGFTGSLSKVPEPFHGSSQRYHG